MEMSLSYLTSCHPVLKMYDQHFGVCSPVTFMEKERGMKKIRFAVLLCWFSDSPFRLHRTAHHPHPAGSASPGRTGYPGSDNPARKHQAGQSGVTGLYDRELALQGFQNGRLCQLPYYPGRSGSIRCTGTGP